MPILGKGKLQEQQGITYKTKDFSGLPVDVSCKRVTFSELSVIPPDGYADANEGYQAQSS